MNARAIFATVAALAFLLGILGAPGLAAMDDGAAAPKAATLAQDTTDANGGPPASSSTVVDDGDDHNGMWSDMGDWGWWLFMPMMLIFWVGLILVIVWAFRGRRPGPGDGGDDPLEIARHGYASGEISREELDQLIQDLRR